MLEICRQLQRRNAYLARIFLCLVMLVASPLAAETVRFDSPQVLPDLSVLAADAKEAETPADWRGQVVVLHFWATWCAPCVEEMPDMNRLAKRYAGNRQVRIVPISQDMTGFVTIKSFYRRYQLDALPSYWDARAKAFKALALTALPSTLIVDREGYVLAQIRGQASWGRNGEGEITTLIEEALKRP